MRHLTTIRTRTQADSLILIHAIQTDEIYGVWTYLMIADFQDSSEASIAELGQAAFICEVDNSRGSMELYPYLMRGENGEISNIDPEEGAYLPFTGDVWINSRNDIHDTATMWLIGGTDPDDPGDTDYQTLFMFEDDHGHQCIVGMLILPVGGVLYWMVFMR